MRIAWVTPFSERSAIGRVSASATVALAERGHDITIVRSERERDNHTPAHPTAFALDWWHNLDVSDIDIRNDVIVLNIGDNYDLHAGVLPFIDGAVCLGIFHDFFIYNLYHQWFAINQFGSDVFDQEIIATYGREALPLGRSAWRSEARLEDLAGLLPMTEWLASRCGAALAHSRFYLNRLEASCPGPVGVAALPFESRNVPLLTPRYRDEVIVTTIGVLNPNKCAAEVIEAICASPFLRARCRYRLAGVVSDAERLRLGEIAAARGFNKVDFLGAIDDATLTKELVDSDILVCLRKPVLEGGSASAIEAMKSGRPVVVANAGFYSDLPEELVFKVPASVDVPALMAVLERLTANESLRVESGARGRAWALKTFTSARYATVVEALAQDFIRAKPALSLGRRIGRDLAVLGVRADDPAVDRLSEKMRELFGA